MCPEEWFRSWFNSPYYDLLYQNRNEQEATLFITKLVDYLKISPAAFLFDVACGKGRHSCALAKYGFDVTGIDLSESSIAHAKQFETDKLHFYVHDIRLPFMINYFNYAFNFFTSFGYFRTKREHDDAMRTIAQSLKPNGILVMDYLNVEYTKDHLVNCEKKKINNVSFDIERWNDEKYFYKKIHTEDNSKKISETFTEQVEKFSLEDFRDILSKQNLIIRDVFGDYKLNAYDIKKSVRMIIIASKVYV